MVRKASTNEDGEIPSSNIGGLDDDDEALMLADYQFV
jgi:hypothetical protein